MAQSKKRSFIEACFNVLVGCIISMIATHYIYKFHGLELSLVTNVVITIWFTGVSIARSYVIRRFMNRYDS